MSKTGEPRLPTPDERVYAAYLDQCLEGQAPEPDDFFRGHPHLGEETRGRIRALHGAMAPGTPEDRLPFERLGEFILEEPLDAGGMGMVYRARQESLGRAVALKIIRPELRGSATATARFRREALAVARLQHPAIVQIHAVGEEQGVLYLAMELVPGDGLDAVLARPENVPARRAAGWIAELSRALDYAHRAGIVHRDVKPSNVRITPDGRAVLLDFGIARDTESQGATLTATFAGSPHYAAPEQLSGAALDGRADVYGLGVTLYQALTGRVPFAGGGMEQILKRVLTEEPVSPRLLNPAVSRDLDTVVRKALEKDPDRRYATAGAFADDLEAACEGRAIRARPPGAVERLVRWSRRRPLAAAGLALLVLAAAGALAAQRLAAARDRDAARDAVAHARQRLADYRTQRDATKAREHELKDLGHKVSAQRLTPEEDRLLDEWGNAVARSRREREAVFYEVLELLRRAERLDPAVAGTDAVRAELFGEKAREAQAADDDDAAGYYRDLAMRHDADLARRIARGGAIRVRGDPVAAEVFLFRRERHPVSARTVAVPFADAPPPFPPGTWALRVVGSTDLVVKVAGHGIEGTVLVADAREPVRPLDRLISIAGRAVGDVYDIETLGADGEARAFVFERDGAQVTVQGTSLAALGVVALDARALAERGGVPATVFRDGVVTEETLPAGLVLRTTASPAFVSPACRLDRGRVRVPFGDYFVVVRHPGHAIVRCEVGVRESQPAHEAVVALPPRERPGFVPVATGSERGLRTFWIMEREVTLAEYLAFLRDPATPPSRAPRHGNPPEFYLRLNDDGTVAHMETGWRLDWPVIGVSYDDARAYAAWRGRRDGVAYRLPTAHEWATAAGPTRYVWGNEFRQKWASSCFARPRPFPEPGMRFPIDESFHGVFDMAGSATEWLDGWHDPARKLRPLGGGSWGDAHPDMFKVWNGAGAAGDRATGTLGFRLVAP